MPEPEDNIPLPPAQVQGPFSDVRPEGERPRRPGLMDIRVIRSLGDLQVDLQVQFVGMVFTVHAGKFIVDGQEGELLHDEHYTVPVRNVDADIQAFLVKNRDTGEYRVLIDDVKVDSEDVAFNFSPTSPFILILSLVLIAVPANCADLRLARKTLYKVKV